MADFDPTRPLAGIRIIECSMLGPAGVTGPFADMGADVIKIEPPNGDYARNMTWPIRAAGDCPSCTPVPSYCR